MIDRYDALSVRENNGKSYFTKIGVAFPNKDGKGFSVLLDAIPAPVDGQFKVMLREPLPKDGQGGGGSQSRRPNTSPDYDDRDDSVPFARNDGIF